MKEKLIHVVGSFRYFKIETISKNLMQDQISAHMFLLHCFKKDKYSKVQQNQNHL